MLQRIIMSISRFLWQASKNTRIGKNNYQKEIKFMVFVLQIINGTKTSPGEFPFSGLIGYQKKDVYKGTLKNGRKIYQVLWFTIKVIVRKKKNWFQDLNLFCSAFKFSISINSKGMIKIKTLWLDSLKRIYGISTSQFLVSRASASLFNHLPCKANTRSPFEVP